MMTAAKQDGIYIPIGVLGTIAAALLIQGIFALIWGAHIDAKIGIIEAQQIQQDRRLDSMDGNGTRRLQLIEDRQVHVMDRLTELEKTLRQHMIDAKRSGIGQTPP